MNNTVTHKLSTVLVLFLLTLPGTLIAQSQEQIDRFNREREDFFNKALQLTDAEKKAFWPLYEDCQNRKMKLVEDERNTWSYAYKNADHLSDKEIAETMEKAYSLKSKQLELEEEYYRGKFLEALPSRKALLLGKVEWDFRRHLLRQLRDQREDQDSEGGRSGRRSEGSGHLPMTPIPW
jgi:hypothetical protein